MKSGIVSKEYYIGRYWYLINELASIQFISGDYFYRPEPREIKKMISVICDSMAAQYVLKKNDC